MGFIGLVRFVASQDHGYGYGHGSQVMEWEWDICKWGWGDSVLLIMNEQIAGWPIASLLGWACFSSRFFVCGVG